MFIYLSPWTGGAEKWGHEQAKGRIRAINGYKLSNFSRRPGPATTF